MIAYIGVEQPFQHDYRYDAQDNVDDFRLSYPDNRIDDAFPRRDVDGHVVREPVRRARAPGRVRADAVRRRQRGRADRKNVYHEDGDGRCVRIESTTPNGTGVETRAYDADGRLTHSETTGGGSTRMQDYTYDDRGRLSSTTDTETNAPYIGQGGSVTSYSYLPDGSDRIVIHDGFTDVGNMQDAAETRTARCLEIDAQIGAPSDPRCRVE